MDEQVNNKEELLLEFQRLQQENNSLKVLYQKDISKHKLVEEKLKRYNDALTKLNKLSFELIMLSADDNFEAFITRRIKEITGAKVALFSEYNSEDRTTTIKQIEIEPGLLKKVVGLLGKQLNEIQVVVSEEKYREMTKEIVGVRKTLHEISFGAISRPVGAAIQTLFNVDRFIGIAFLVEGKLYGTCVLAMKKGQPDPQREIIENLAFMTAGELRRRKTETDLREKESFNYAMFRVNPIATIVVDAKGVICDVNIFQQKLNGRLPDIGDVMYRDYAIKHKIDMYAELMNCINTGASKNFPDMKYKEKNLDITLTPFDQGALITCIDITDRKQAEKALKGSEERYRALYDDNPLMIFTIDTEGIILSVNETGIVQLEYSREELLGNSVLLLFHDNDKQKVIELKEKCLHNPDEIVSWELRKISKNGKLIYVNENARVIQANDGSKFILIMCEDITERKDAEVALVKSKEKAEESDRLKSSFLANLSHEIRTPMNGILGFAGLLKNSKLGGDKQQEYINIIEKSGARMLNIINDIVDISKIDSGQITLSMSQVNIIDTLENINTLLKPDAEQKGLKLLLKNSLLLNKATIRTDKEKFIAIVNNLVKNAIRYTNKGTIEFGCEIKDNFLECFVNDTGIGIPKDRQEVIFERFIQADIEDKMARQGTGLGLAISKYYVELLGGKILVVSKDGEGSSFQFKVPCSLETEDQKRIVQDVGIGIMENQTKNLKILIAEDDETSGMLMTIQINAISEEILIARTGKEAIEVCRKNPNIDLILMDIQMPEMNGYKATQQIRQFNKDVIIIAQTSYGLSGDREKALEAGCNDYISKPINKNELLALLQKYFKKKLVVNGQLNNRE